MEHHQSVSRRMRDEYKKHVDNLEMEMKAAHEDQAAGVESARIDKKQRVSACIGQRELPARLDVCSSWFSPVLGEAPAGSCGIGGTAEGGQAKGMLTILDDRCMKITWCRLSKRP